MEGSFRNEQQQCNSEPLNGEAIKDQQITHYKYPMLYPIVLGLQQILHVFSGTMKLQLLVSVWKVLRKYGHSHQTFEHYVLVPVLKLLPFTDLLPPSLFLHANKITEFHCTGHIHNDSSIIQSSFTLNTGIRWVTNTVSPGQHR